jgi:glycosyltransferase involved in cell wall biosynthesis
VPEGWNRSNGGSLGNLPPGLRKREGEKQILFLSRINFKKGLDLLAKAFGAVCRRRDDVRLIIAGPDDDGFGEQLKRWLRDEGALDRTTFTGMLLGADKTAAFAAADVFVLPSYDENFAIAAVEAMSYRLPVIISNKVGIWHEVQSAGAGEIINCDATELTASILRLLDNPARSREMGLKGRRLVEESFTWDAVGSRMLDVYRTIVSEKAARTAAAANN